MNVFINGELTSLINEQPNILHALSIFLNDAQQKQSFAVALNGNFVGKEHYQETDVHEGDSLDVLFPIQGG